MDFSQKEIEQFLSARRAPRREGVFWRCERRDTHPYATIWLVVCSDNTLWGTYYYEQHAMLHAEAWNYAAAIHEMKGG